MNPCPVSKKFSPRRERSAKPKAQSSKLKGSSSAQAPVSRIVALVSVTQRIFQSAEIEEGIFLPRMKHGMNTD
jgi:hypothetical protein